LFSRNARSAEKKSAGAYAQRLNLAEQRRRRLEARGGRGEEEPYLQEIWMRRRGRGINVGGKRGGAYQFMWAKLFKGRRVLKLRRKVVWGGV